MNAQWIVGVAGPLLAFLTYIIGRRSKQKVEETDSVSGAIEAVTDGVVSMSHVVTELMEPMRDEVARLHSEVADLRSLTLTLRRELTIWERKFNAAIRHIHKLRNVIEDAGLEVPDPPAELTDELED